MKIILPALTATLLIANAVAWSQSAPTGAPSQTNAAPPPPAAANAPDSRVNSAIIPNLSSGFMTKHNQNVEVAKKGDIDVLFMGDSITDFWRNAGRGNATNGPLPMAGKAVFDKYFGAMKVANFGISGDTTQGVLWRLDNGEGQGFKPKVIMLMIGTNNTGRNSPPEIAIGIADVVFKLREDFPDAKILLLAVFPRSTAGSRLRTAIAEINKIIPALRDDQHVFYMDIGAKFLAEDGSIPRDIMSDQLHPTSKGYEIWAEAVHDTLVKLMQ